MSYAVVFLCTKKELTRERRGYFQAFSKKISTVCLCDIDQENINNLNEIIPPNLEPILILYPDSYPRRLPHGLVETKFPTACFSIDTYEDVKDRIKFSMLFDYAFVFHPDFDRLFTQANHPKAFCLPHAVEANLFEGEELERIYDVGWVGRLDGKNYSVRRRCIEKLRHSFVMNNVSDYYEPEAMASIYKQSKIVINLGRNDYLQDANLRCFEAMAAGCLLITHKPTELAQLGFIENTHYIAYQKEAEIEQLITFYLERETERLTIASAAKHLTMTEHTYDRRVDRILDILAQGRGRRFAPVSYWKESQVQALYVWYFSKNLMLEAALRELYSLSHISRFMAWYMIPGIVKAFFIKIRISL